MVDCIRKDLNITTLKFNPLETLVKSIGLPKECIILSINRGIEEIVPRGDTVLHLGDHLTILVNKENREVTKDILHKFFTLEI